MDTATLSPELKATEARFYRQNERTAKNFGHGATDGAIRIAEKCFERLEAAMKAKLEEPVKPSKGWDEKVHRVLKLVPPSTIAVAAIDAALHAAIMDEVFTSSAENLGLLINDQVFAHDLRSFDKKKAGEIERWVKEQHGSLKYRLQAARSLAKKTGFSFVNRWKPQQLVAVGTFVLDVLLVTLPDLFTDYYRADARYLGITEEANDIADEALKQHIRRFPVFLPSAEPPVPWTDFTGGGPVDPAARKLAKLMRTKHRETEWAAKGAIKSGQMQPALDALNAVQAVPWQINTYIFNVMKECKRRGVEVKGLPSDVNVEPSALEKEWDDLTDDEKKLVRQERAEAKQENHSLRNDRRLYIADMETAELLMEHGAFYIPHSLDWRGREYPMTRFNFQREDRVRALFLFKEGEPITEKGIWWLKVHVANCGDFGKVSKKSYDERVKWVDDNLERIKDCAAKDWERGGPLTPEALSFWTQADKPFLFLAACAELTNALTHGPDYVCCLPCSWDGSCSGAQHLCAATRSEDGWKVNLTPLEQPQDLYTRVGSTAKGTLALSDDPVAKLVLAYDGDWRKVFKRNTMTTFYGSKSFGMTQQHMEDLMDPLKREVLKKKRREHPFGKTRKEHFAAARVLSTSAAAAISQELPLPMKAMEFLQALAAVMAHAGKPMEWTTPVGIPWSNRYHPVITERVSLWMHDHGVRRPYRPLVAVGHEKEIEKSRAVNGSAPNFVHALDAGHLLRTVNAARREGIKQFALVHDSFGSLPSHAERFQAIIREAFVEMYETHDVLTEVLQRAKCDLGEHNDRLSEIEDMRAELTGNLNIKEVLNAKYAFA